MIKVNEKSNRQQTELILRSSPPTGQSEQRWGNGMMMKRGRKGEINRNGQRDRKMVARSQKKGIQIKRDRRRAGVRAAAVA